MKNKKQTFVAGLGMLALAVFLLLPVTASAQGRYRDGRWDNNPQRRDRDWGRDRNWGGNSAQLRQTALNAGYNNGIQEGRKDRQRGERFEYRDEGDFRDASEDYNSRFGNRELYRQYFRQGFANGYRDGYRGY